jgi:hypothetical protein
LLSFLSTPQVRNARLPKHQQKSYASSGFWWFGLSGVILGSLCTFAALGIASQSLVAGLSGGAVLIINVFLAKYMVKDDILFSDVLGAGFILAGALVLLADTPPAENLTGQQLKHNFERRSFVIYLVITLGTLGIILSTIVNSQFYEWRRRLTRIITHPVTKPLENIIKAQHELIVQMEARLCRTEDEIYQLRTIQQVLYCTPCCTLCCTDTAFLCCTLCCTAAAALRPPGEPGTVLPHCTDTVLVLYSHTVLILY